MVGSNSAHPDLLAQAGSGIVYLDADLAVFDERLAQDAPPGAGRVGRVVQQIRENALDQIRVGMRAWLASGARRVS